MIDEKPKVQLSAVEEAIFAFFAAAQELQGARLIRVETIAGSTHFKAELTREEPAIHVIHPPPPQA